MTNRDDDIAERVAEWLDRFAVPTHLADKPDAAQKEADAILRMFRKYAPAYEWGFFLNRVFDAIDGIKKSRYWPTPHDVGACCVNIAKETPKGNRRADVEMDMSPEAIVGRRMERGEAVGEGWLYGRDAVSLIVRGLVDEKTMTAYRSGAFLARREIYGEEAALEWEREAKARHEVAKALHRERNEPRRKYDTGFAVNRMAAE
jgi:hypothetical protein